MKTEVNGMKGDSFSVKVASWNCALIQRINYSSHSFLFACVHVLVLHFRFNKLIVPWSNFLPESLLHTSFSLGQCAGRWKCIYIYFLLIGNLYANSTRFQQNHCLRENVTNKRIKLHGWIYLMQTCHFNGSRDRNSKNKTRKWISIDTAKLKERRCVWMKRGVNKEQLNDLILL